MPAVIPREIKDSVVQGWLAGLARRPNAMKHGVSKGSLDNFVEAQSNSALTDIELLCS